MNSSTFQKATRCNGVKIWSHEQMDSDMMLFGWSAFNAFQRGLEAGEVSESGCVYSNAGLFAYAKKTKSGIGSVRVGRDSKTQPPQSKE